LIGGIAQVVEHLCEACVQLPSTAKTKQNKTKSKKRNQTKPKHQTRKYKEENNSYPHFHLPELTSLNILAFFFHVCCLIRWPSFYVSFYIHAQVYS
jgi:hypothetical protein